jgi:protein SCO1/2
MLKAHFNMFPFRCCIVLSLFLLSASALAEVPGFVKSFGPAPHFKGTDYDNNEFLSESLLGNRTGIVNFFFTSCKGPCPALMLKIRRILDATECKSAHFVSISVDPENDTPDVIREYAHSRGLLDEKWSIITMPEDDVINLLNEGFRLGTGGDIVNHSTRIVIMDSEGRIRSYIPGMDDDTVQKTLSAINYLCSK